MAFAGMVQAAPAVGTAAIIENAVSGTPEDATSAVALQRGDRVYANERIETAKDSKAQLLFLDQTVLSMAPESAVVLDKYVYDPERNVGTVVLETTAGAFRFVGGTADTTAGSSYTVKTPVGTIGIRGTLFEWEVRGEHLWAMLREGAVDVCLQSRQCVGLTQPGTYLVTGGSQLSGVKRWEGPTGEAQGTAKATHETNQLYTVFLNSRGFSAATTPAPSSNAGSGSGGQQCNPGPNIHC
jgi:hypothetical protein